VLPIIDLPSPKARIALSARLAAGHSISGLWTAIAGSDVSECGSIGDHRNGLVRHVG